MALKEALIRIGLTGTKEVRKGLDELGKGFSGLEAKTASWRKSLDKTSRQLNTIGRTLSTNVTLPIAGLAYGVAKATIEFESFTQQLKAASKAGTQLSDLQNIAVLPGLDTASLTKAQAQLEILGINAQDATKLIVNLANAIALEGKGPEDFEGITRAISQIIGKNRVQAEEINQLAERTAFIRKILSEEFGTAEALSINKQLADQGAGVQTFLAHLAVGFSRLERAPDTLKNQLINLADTLKVSAGSIGLNIAELFNLREIILGAAIVIGKLKEQWDGLSDRTKKIIVVVTAATAAIGPLFLIISGGVSIVSAIAGAIFSWQAAIGALIIALPGLAVWLTKLIYGVESWGEAIDLLIREVVRFGVLAKEVFVGLFDEFRAFGAALATFSVTRDFGAAWEVFSKSGAKAWDEMVAAADDAANNIYNKSYGKRFSTFIDNTKNKVKELGAEFQNLKLEDFDLSKDFDFTVPPKRTVEVKRPKPNSEKLTPVGDFLQRQELEEVMGLIDDYLVQLDDWKDRLDDINGGLVLNDRLLAKVKAGIVGATENIRDYVDVEKNREEQMERQRIATEKAREPYVKLSEFVSGNLTGAFEGFFSVMASGGANAFGAFIDGIKKVVVQLAAAVATATILTALFSIISGGVSGGLSTIKNVLGFAANKSLFSGFLKGLVPFAEGGIVTGPTTALIGEAGPEAVIPLNQFKNIIGGRSVDISGEFVIRGSDLLRIIDRNSIDRNRRT